MRPFLPILFIVLALGSCKERRKVTPAIYYWKTNYRPTAFEKEKLEDLHCKTMYLHYFDVGWDEAAGEPTPIVVMHLPDSMDNETSYIPVVFITQDALQDMSRATIEKFALNVARLTEDISANARVKPKEIQIDCDWTYKTRDQYFAILAELRKQEYFKGKVLSCTIRMHQVKYRSKSGIPPVDRGLLMCYNMGNIKNPRVKNSILDNEIASQYLKDMESYPLPLDIALPLFDWSLQFRNNKMVGILRGIDIGMLQTAPFLEKETGNVFVCTADTVWERCELLKGDKIRWEESSLDDIKEMARYTSAKISNKEMKLSFFHCDSLTLSKYPSDELEKVIDTYR